MVVVTVRDRVYDPAYDDINSARSRALILELEVFLVPFFRRTFRFFRYIVFIRFFRGSVGVDFELGFEPQSNITNTVIEETLLEANATKEVEFLVFGNISATEVTPTTLTPITTMSPTGTLFVDK